MLFLTLGNFLMLSIQFMKETIRYRRYWNIMQRLFQTASVVVQRSRCGYSSGRSRASLLNMSESSENVEFEDDHIQISSIHPVQEIDLSTWTAYTPYLEIHNATVDPNKNIYVLMESRRPRQLSNFVNNTLKIPPAHRVHVLSLGCPVAWKTAEPFGIVLHCSFAGLVSLSDAFGQGKLTLDEDLELTSFATIRTIGNPQKLVPQVGEILSVNDENVLQNGTPHKKDEPVTMNGSSQLSRGIYNDDVETQSNGRDSSETYTSETNILSVGKHQQVNNQFNSSSNNNIEVDHTEIFVVQQPKQITANISHKESTESPPSVYHDNNNSKLSVNNDKSGQDGPRAKPPNILVYCGIKDSSRKFAQVKSSLEACVNTDAYTIYHLKDDSILTTPWRSNAVALIVSSCSHLRPEVENEITKFVVENGGTLLSFSSSIDSAFVDKYEDDSIDGLGLVSFKYKDDQYITSVRGRYYYGGFKENCEVIIPFESSLQDRAALMVKIKCDGGGHALISKLMLERDPSEFAKDPDSFAALKQSNPNRLAFLGDILTTMGIDTSSGSVPPLTPCLLLAQRVVLKESFLDSFKHRLKDNNLLKSQKLSLKFVRSTDQVEATPTMLPVITNLDIGAEAEYFNPQTYWKNLGTRKLGQVLFYTEVITSTMSVFDGLQFSVPDSIGLIAVAGRQTSGRGRGGNSWLSPAGCAMFTLPLSIGTDSELGQRVSFLQHIISVAVVQSILSLPGYENLNIKLKWPNDIYYGKEMKLGGVLVTSTILDSKIYATIGCGFNVSNSNPTICINDIIRLSNTSNPDLAELSPLNPSQLIARTVTCLEKLLDNFEKDGHQDFCRQYYKYWLHGDSKVQLHLEKETEGVIVGIDDFGFLSVRTPDGTISVQPDGNSFDMLHNLIHTKPHS